MSEKYWARGNWFRQLWRGRQYSGILLFLFFCCWSWSSNTLATWCEEATHWKRPWCWEGLKAVAEGDNREWYGWMASPTWWKWVWESSRGWWWTGRLGMLQSGIRKRHNWATKLNWNSVQGFQFLYIFANVVIFLSLLGNNHSNMCEMISYCNFNFYASDV